MDGALHLFASAVDLFRPRFDEENAGDMKVTARILWRGFFGHDIDVLEKIIRPTSLRDQIILRGT